MTPPGSGTTYSSIATLLVNSSNPYLSGGTLTVTAKGTVALLGGLCISGNLRLPSNWPASAMLSAPAKT